MDITVTWLTVIVVFLCCVTYSAVHNGVRTQTPPWQHFVAVSYVNPRHECNENDSAINDLLLGKNARKRPC